MTKSDHRGLLHRTLSGSRYLMLIAVLGSFLASLVVLILSGLDLLHIISDLISGGHRESETVIIEIIQLIDSFLLGTVLYIFALGLYQLFINSDFEMPKWLHIETLDDLKERLLALIAVMLAVIFLKNIVAWDHTINILWLGIAIGLVFLAIAYVLGTVWNLRLRRIEAENIIAGSDSEKEGVSAIRDKQE